MGNEDRGTNKETELTNKTTMVSETYRNLTERKDPQKTTADKSDNTTRRN